MDFIRDADQCAVTHKKCFTKKQATKARTIVELAEKKPLRIYKCHYCFDYHLTSKPNLKKGEKTWG